MSWGDKYYVRLRLSRWGRWGCESGPVMLPSISGRMLETTGRFTTAMKEMPAEIAEIDHIVHQLDAELKMALIDYYPRQVKYTEGGRTRGLSAHLFKQLVRRAEVAVQGELF